MLEGERLVNRAAEREAAFRRLVDERLDDSYRIARLILRNGQDAEDATHDAVLAAWRRWGSLRDANRFDAWFSRILVNTCRDRIRRRIVRTTAALDESTPDGAQPYSDVDDLDAMGRAFETLNTDQRTAVVLRYWADLPVEEIAGRVGAPVGTVKSRLHHAIGRLREVLSPAREAGHD